MIYAGVDQGPRIGAGKEQGGVGECRPGSGSGRSGRSGKLDAMVSHGCSAPRPYPGPTQKATLAKTGALAGGIAEGGGESGANQKGTAGLILHKVNSHGCNT